jgi:dihydrofolate reductase
MRKLIMWNLMSLDGFVEGSNRDISWHNDVWGPELEQFSIEQGKEIGALLFGRVTYELMAGYWPTAKKSEITDYMNALPKYVFSRTLQKVDWANTTLLKGDPAGRSRR